MTVGQKPGAAPLPPPKPSAVPSSPSALVSELLRPPTTLPAEEEAAQSLLAKLKRRVTLQSYVIIGLAGVMLAFLPFSRPVYLYYAMKPDRQVLRMVGIDMPNMTNRAILSWATTSITEVMTMGFGDIETRLPKQRPRFTKRGWKVYQKAFVDQKIGETFRQSQLVLTTVPSNTPVITSQGVNPDQVYQWTVEMPVIMTYATNNNVMRKQKAVITLTIVRIPAEENSAGIAIQSWELL